jgi:DNA-directed RNA polymerase specialized sigma24 family protein
MVNSVVITAAEPRAMFLRAIEVLEPPLAAVMDFHLAGLPMSAAAASLQIPSGTAWTRLRAAREAVSLTVRRWVREETQSPLRAITR